MILYHGTNSSSTSFRETHFGKSDRHANGALGIWASLTPVIPMNYGGDVLVLKSLAVRVKEIPNARMLQIDDDLIDLSPDEIHVHYQNIRQRLIKDDIDVVAIMEHDDTLGNFIILSPANVEILDRVPASDIERLSALEMEHWDEDLMSRKSDFVSSLNKMPRRRRIFG
jgi:hypothetical protein